MYSTISPLSLSSAAVVVTTAATTLTSVGFASATVIYDSEGFEAATFSPGNLVPQDGWSSFGVLGGNNSDATVSTTAPVAGGTQAVELYRDPADSAGNTGFFVDVTGSAHERYVFIDFDMYVEDSGDQDPDPVDISYGPGFGVEIYIPGYSRIASFGVDSADTAFYQATSGGGLSYTYPGLLLDVYQHWTVTLDFVDEVYFVEVDGDVIGTGLFLEDIDYAGGDRLSDASIVLSPTDSSYFDVEGTAYLDNYIITDDTAIPEPGSLALLGLGAMLIARRRRV